MVFNYAGIVVLNILTIQNTFGQIKDSITITFQTPLVNYEKMISKDKGIGKQILKGGLRFYKKYISSQDGSNCNFKPSCSEYCYLSIKKKGVFWGILNSFDRLTRCNGTRLGYHLDPESNRLHDPL